MSIEVCRSFGVPTFSVELMKDVKVRYKTFVDNLWVFEIQPIELAKAGFYREAIAKGDEVRCAFCHVLVWNWSRGELDAKKRHETSSPCCAFVLSSFVECQQVIDSSCRTLFRRRYQSGNLDELITFAVDYGIILHAPPIHKAFISNFMRLRSLPKTTALYGQYGLNDYAKSGFFYSNNAFICYHCGINYSEQNAEIHDPYGSHAADSPDCEHINIVKGVNFVSQAKKLVEERRHCIAKLMLTPQVYELLRLETFTRYMIRSALLEIYSNIDAIWNDTKTTNVDLTYLRRILSRSLSMKNLRHFVDDYGHRRLHDSYRNRHLKSRNDIRRNGRNYKYNDYESNFCNECFENPLQMTALPCGHFTLCKGCAAGISICIVCRSVVKGYHETVKI